MLVRNDFSLSRTYPCEMSLKEVTVIKVRFTIFINHIYSTKIILYIFVL